MNQLTRTELLDERTKPGFCSKNVFFGFGQSSRYVTSPLSDKLIVC